MKSRVAQFLWVDDGSVLRIDKVVVADLLQDFQVLQPFGICHTFGLWWYVISTKCSAWRDLVRFLDYARNDRW